MSKKHHLENLCVIHLDFDIWSGQTRLTAKDLKLGDGGEVPPEKIAQLGSKRICDPAKLREFHRLKTEARRLLLRVGMPFMNGFAIPIYRVDEICQRLDTIKQKFDIKRQQFVDGYIAAVNEWCDENPKYSLAIRDGALSKDTVEEKIGLEYQVFMIEGIQSQQEASKRLQQSVEGLGDDLVDEVVREAEDFYQKRLAGKNRCSISTAPTLKNIRDKVDGLSFLNGALAPLVTLLDETLQGYKQATSRYVEKPFFYQLMAAVLIMTERSRIEAYANGTVTVDGMAASMSNGDVQSDSVTTNADDDGDAGTVDVDADDEGAAPESTDSTEPASSQRVDTDDIDAFIKDFKASEAQGDESSAPEPGHDEGDVSTTEPTTDVKSQKESEQPKLASKAPATVSTPQGSTLETATEPVAEENDGDFFF